MVSMRGHVLLMSLIILLSPGCTYEPGNPPLNEPEEVFEGEPILGCTDSEAKNYNSEANEDDGSCEYDEPEPEPVLGCTDSEAMNYDSNATEDDAHANTWKQYPAMGW